MTYKIIDKVRQWVYNIITVRGNGKPRNKKMKEVIVMTNTRAQEIAQEINNSQEWDNALLAELCELAGMTAEWESADGESFENVVYAAAEKLGVEID